MHRQGCPLFDAMHPIFTLPTTASPILHGALKDGFGEAAEALDKPEPCECPSLDSGRKRFPWAHKVADLTSHPVVSLLLRAGDAEKFPQALGLKNLDSFLRVSKQGPCLKALEPSSILSSN